MTSSFLPYRSDYVSDLREIKNLLIVVAMESEEKALLEGMRPKEISYGQKVKIVGSEFAIGAHQITVARSGIGLVNAGILLAMMAEHRWLDAVIMLGVGGALDPKLHCGDTVVATEVLQHDSIVSAEGGPHFIAPGELSLSRSDRDQVDPIARCDSFLVNWLTETLESADAGKTFRGALVSGSEFVGSLSKKMALHRIHKNALLVDMESAAIAQIARRLQIPFAVAKTVADRAAPETSVAKDYQTSLEAAAKRSASVLKGLLRAFE